MSDHPQKRVCPLYGDVVLLAPRREARPQEYRQAPRVDRAAACPFCPGSETETPAETLAIGPADRQPDQPGWSVRIIPNRFPAVLSTVGERSPTTETSVSGQHEVVVETPRHVSSWADFSQAELEIALQAWSMRLAQLQRDGVVRHATLFKNCGPEAGASIEHAHSQLIALDFVPPRAAAAANQVAECRREGREIWSEFMEAARAQGRLVWEDDWIVAFCPPAPRFSWATWIVPRQQGSFGEDLEAGARAAIAGLLRRLTIVLQRSSGTADHNVVLSLAPFDLIPNDQYYWHMEIFPRTAKAAGFEWGSGCCLVSTPPEIAAVRLRDEVEALARLPGGDPPAD